MVEFDLCGQPEFFEGVMKFIDNNKLSHAYLIETKDSNMMEPLVETFARLLYDSSKYHDNGLTSIQNMTSSGNFISVKPEGAMIKKNQILDIQEKYKTKSFDNHKRIYVIYEADKLNKQSANSLLKFLEEPEENIIAILVVNNRYRVLETIRSRCQVLSLKNSDFVPDFENKELIFELITLLEKKGPKSIAYFPIACNNEYFSKEMWINIFQSMQFIYEQALRKKVDINYSATLENILKLIVSSNNMNRILYKIDIISKTMNYLEYSLNLSLMQDKFIIEFTGGDIYA